VYGLQQISSAADDAFEQLSLNFTATTSGYLYIYVSNESTLDVNVYFDDLKITHKSNLSIINAEDYYPFGLTFNEYQNQEEQGNFNLYQGKELQEDLGLNTYDFHARMYDPTIGRTFQLDPHLENYYDWSPYSWAGDNPIIMIDPSGMDWYTHSESGNLHWYNGTYGDDKIPDGYKRLGDNNFFGEKSFERLQLAKKSNKDETGEALTSMSFNEEQSGLLAKEFGFEKVPTKQFHYTSETNTPIGFGVVTSRYDKVIVESYSYVPKNYVAETKSQWGDMLDYYGGWGYNAVDIEQITYSESMFGNIFAPVIKALDIALKIKQGGHAGNAKMDGTKPYKSWSEYPQSGPLNKYRPGGKFRTRLGL